MRRLRSKSPSACCAPETRWLGGSFLLVYRNNAGRLGSGFISACLETRWLGPKSGFYVPERYCTYSAYFVFWYEFGRCRSCMFLSGIMHGGLLREVGIYIAHLLFNFCHPTQSTQVYTSARHKISEISSWQKCFSQNFKIREFYAG